jgi:spore coat protein U-like protein
VRRGAEATGAMMRRAWVAVALLLASRNASAGPASCSLTLASIDLGTYDVFGATDLTWSGTIRYVCNGPVQHPIIIDFDAGNSGSIAPRLASNGAGTQLGYNLYTDPANQIVWYDGNGGTGEYTTNANPANGRTYLVPVYGRIQAQQDVAAGTYTDSLVATIYWTEKKRVNSTSITVPLSAAVPATCSIAAAPIGFGAYDPIGANATAPSDATGAVTTTCTRGAATTIALDLGRNPAGAQRRMTDGAGHFLPYGLFQDAAHTTPWGSSGADLLSPAPAPGSGPRTFTVYGEIPGAQDPFVGSYVDTVTATVAF